MQCRDQRDAELHVCEQEVGGTGTLSLHECLGGTGHSSDVSHNNSFICCCHDYTHVGSSRGQTRSRDHEFDTRKVTGNDSQLHAMFDMYRENLPILC